MKKKTYSNLCVLNVEEAEYLYNGECKSDTKPVVITENPNLNPNTTIKEEVEPINTNQIDIPVETENPKENIIKRIWNFFIGLFK